MQKKVPRLLRKRSAVHSLPDQVLVLEDLNQLFSDDKMLEISEGIYFSRYLPASYEFSKMIHCTGV